MAVFTDLSAPETSQLLEQFRLGQFQQLKGIASGIENSNFFLSTTQGEFVLTVFERLRAEQLPFYLGLMQHLAQAGLPVPEPYPTHSGSLFATVHGKPVAIVARVPGQSVLTPGPLECAQVGRFLAHMHVRGANFGLVQPNLRGLPWWRDAIQALQGHVSAPVARILATELQFQEDIAHDPRYALLPSGPIHADLFRDNVLFDGDQIGGVIDFYFAGCGPWLFDLAVTVNDWCVDLDSGAFDLPRAQALIRAYHTERPLLALEHDLWQATLRAAALRFWVSRLYDFHLPRPASVLTPHDPSRFERMLDRRIHDSSMPWL
jgi:homoserine kinase type II